MMGLVSARRALIGVRRKAARRTRGATAAPVFWGRVGAYEAVTRDGMLLLLAPDPVHPAKRVVTGA
jgi:hypothetical protein